MRGFDLAAIQMNTTQALAIILIVIAGLTACQKSSAPIEQAATNNSAATQFQDAQGGTTPQAQTKFFKGSIGSALGLHMKLVREGDRLTGTYFYQKVGTKIDLRGTIDKDGNVILEEFDTAGKQTGTFSGFWKTDEEGLIALSGNWAKPNSDKKTAFSLHEEPIEFSSGVEIVARRITEKNKSLKYEIDAEYPQLVGAVPNSDRFNQIVRGLVLGKVADFKKEMAPAEDGESQAESTQDFASESTRSDLGIGYTVKLAKDDLISIEFGVGSYYRGAAHPNSYTQTVNFDLKNGKPIKLSDLFQSGSKFLPTISSYCVQELKKKSREQGADSMLDDDWIKRGAGPEAKNYQSWTIGRKGLGINFDAYQVAPYAAGPQYVMIPYSALKEIIRIEGPVGQFL